MDSQYLKREGVPAQAGEGQGDLRPDERHLRAWLGSPFPIELPSGNGWETQTQAGGGPGGRQPHLSLPRHPIPSFQAAGRLTESSRSLRALDASFTGTREKGFSVVGTILVKT